MIKQQENGDDRAVTWPDGTRPMAGVLFIFFSAALNSTKGRKKVWNRCFCGQPIIYPISYFPNWLIGQEPVA
jgi:hypothetical protein